LRLLRQGFFIRWNFRRFADKHRFFDKLVKLLPGLAKRRFRRFCFRHQLVCCLLRKPVLCDRLDSALLFDELPANLVCQRDH
jgi:hypothetical protein